MSDIAAVKRAARAAACSARAEAHAADPGAAARAAAHVAAELGSDPGGRIVSGYLPIRTELDPLPALRALHDLGYRLCVPVIEAKGRPLGFRRWAPGVATMRGPFDVEIPVQGETVEPDVLLVPLLAFDARGFRLGYGGGFFDRTLQRLRGAKPVRALGFAYAAQRVAEVPVEETDARLDAVITEAGVLHPAEPLAARALPDYALKP